MRKLAASIVLFMLLATDLLSAETSGGTAMVAAARAFTASLTPEQRGRCIEPFDAPDRTRWHYVPDENRKGIPLDAMDTNQQDLAKKLLAASMSEAGLKKALTVLELEALIQRLERNNEMRDPSKYHFTIYGDPALTGRWGLSIEGHHLSLNYVVNNGRIECATPLFIGANPARVVTEETVGPPPGTRSLATEEDQALVLVRSLDTAQQQKAIVAGKTAMDMREAPKPQTDLTSPTEGIASADLSAEQRAQLLALCETVMRNAPDEIAEVELPKVRKDPALHFAWYGKTGDGEPFSCRIHGSSVLILLFKAQSDSIGNKANHTHLLWRTPGGDFGAN